MEAESVVARGMTDELHSCNIQGGLMEGESMVLLKVSLMNLILGISKEIK